MSLFGNNFAMKSIHLLEKGVDTAVLRRKVLANNIANVDVPHFKRSEVAFEEELKRALDIKKSVKSESPLQINHSLHIKNRQYPSEKQVRPTVHTDYLSKMRNDGNNVDIEDEISKLIRNQLQYNLMIDRLSSKFRHMNGLLRSGL